MTQKVAFVGWRLEQPTQALRKLLPPDEQKDIEVEKCCRYCNSCYTVIRAATAASVFEKYKSEGSNYILNFPGNASEGDEAAVSHGPGVLPDRSFIFFDPVSKTYHFGFALISDTPTFKREQIMKLFEDARRSEDFANETFRCLPFQQTLSYFDLADKALPAGKAKTVQVDRAEELRKRVGHLTVKIKENWSSLKCDMEELRHNLALLVDCFRDQEAKNDLEEVEKVTGERRWFFEGRDMSFLYYYAYEFNPDCEFLDEEK